MTLLTIPPPPGSALELGPLTVHFYGIAIAVGVLVGVTVLRRRYAALGGDPDLTDRAAIWAVAAGLVGARLGYVATNLDRFLDRPLAVVAVWEGGLVFFGGLTLGALTALWYVRRHGGDLPTFADAVAPAIPLAHAIGRWGNYFNEELYGTPTDLPWGLEVTHEPAPVHPTFLYESLANLALAGVLVLVGRRGRLARGALIFCYAAGYGIVRFLLELIRTDTDFRLLGLSRNAYAAIAILLVGVVGGLWWQRRQAEAAAPSPAGHDPGGPETGEPDAGGPEPSGPETAGPGTSRGTTPDREGPA